MYLALKNALGKSFILFRGLLNEFSGAAAAYSLRRLGPYNGPAVRIRRASDNVEVNVAFNGAKAVGTDSPITNTTEQGGESGSTTATTLGEFLTEDVIVYSSDYSSGVDSWSFGGGSLSASESIGGEDNALKATRSGDGFFFPQKNGVLVDGETYTITLKLYVPSSNTNPNLNFNVREASGGPIVATNLSQSDAWETFTVSLTAGAGNQVVQVTSNVSMTGGDVFYIKDFVATQTSGNTATVHTWYDQSGNAKDATQDTTGSQPKIAETGSLLDDGIGFDGTDDFLATGQSVITQSNTGSFSYFGVSTIATDEGGYFFGSAGNGSNVGSSIYAQNDSKFSLSSGFELVRDNITRSGGENLVSACYTGGRANFRVNGGGTSVTEGTFGFDANANFTIANREDGSSAATFLAGSIKEIIVYDSDQSADRTAIESNIDDYYDII